MIPTVLKRTFKSKIGLQKDKLLIVIFTLLKSTCQNSIYS